MTEIQSIPTEQDAIKTATEIVQNNLRNMTPEDRQKARVGIGLKAAMFASSFADAKKQPGLYRQIYDLLFFALEDTKEIL